MVTPTYTVVLLQLAIMLHSRAKPASPLCEQRNVPLATAIRCPTPVADKNLVASKPTNTPTRPHKAKMVTTTYTVVLLQLAILLDPRAKPASPPVFNHKTRAKASGIKNQLRHIVTRIHLDARRASWWQLQHKIVGTRCSVQIS